MASITGTINMLCDGDSCIVAGSEKRMPDYIAAVRSDPKAKYPIIKARYGHVPNWQIEEDSMSVSEVISCFDLRR